MTAGCGASEVIPHLCLPIGSALFIVCFVFVFLMRVLIRQVLSGRFTEDRSSGGRRSDRSRSGARNVNNRREEAGEDENREGNAPGRLRAVPWGQLLMVGIGLAAIGLGVFARIAPAAVPAALSLSTLPFDARPVHIIIGGGLLLLQVSVSAELLGVRRRTTNSGDIGREVTEVVRIDTTQESVADTELRRTLETVGDHDLAPARRTAATERLQERLQGVAVATLVHVDGQDPATARTRVADGTWTERRDVAAFLGGADAPGMPLRYRLLDWLSGDPAALRRSRRAVAELERIGSADARPGGESV